MKCTHCNVELGNDNHHCPLCGNKAVHSKENIHCSTASYPKLAVRKASK